MEPALRYRMIGATFWMLLLVLWVPSWFSAPVNFQPQGDETPGRQRISAPLLLSQAPGVAQKPEQQAKNLAAQNTQAVTKDVRKNIAPTPAKPPEAVKPQTAPIPAQVPKPQVVTPTPSVPAKDSRSTTQPTAKPQAPGALEQSLTAQLPPLKSDEVISPVTQVRSAEYSQPKPSTPGKIQDAYYLQLICYADVNQALAFSTPLKKRFTAEEKIVQRPGKGPLYCVRVGPLGGRLYAEETLQKLNGEFKVQGYLIAIP